MRSRNLPLTLFLTATLAFMSGCSAIDSDGDDTVNEQPNVDGSNDNSVGTGGDTVPEGIAGATMHRGVINRDGLYRIMNSAVSIMDADHNPILYLDGGDFEVIPGGESEPDPEGHHNAQKLDQVTGKVTLMLDISQSMDLNYGDFEKLQEAAKSFINQMLALNIPVDVYPFDFTEKTVISFPPGTLETDVAAAIDSLTVGESGTDYYNIVAERVTALVGDDTTPGVNWVDYTHDGASTPGAHVELMVIMSDGRTNGSGSGSIIDAAKDKRFSVASIPVGGNPDAADMETYSEFLFAVPDSGTYLDAINEAARAIKNYYLSFYVVEYMPPKTDETGAKTFDVDLLGSSSTFTVYYDGPLTGLEPAPVCCEVWLNPNVDPTNVSVAAGTDVEIQVEKLWTTDDPWFTWSLSNSDGGMTLEPDSIDSSVATVTTISSGSTGQATVTTQDGSWTSAPIPISIQ